MKTLLKKVGAVLLTAAVTVGSLWCTPKESKAADSKYETIYQSDVKQVVAGEEQTFEFNVKGGKTTYALISAASVISGSVTYYKDGVYETVIPINDYDCVYSDGIYSWVDSWTPTTDCTYKAVVTLDTATSYYVDVLRDAVQVEISNTKLTITEGFSHKLSVTNTSGSVKWSTSNSKIATVSSTGLVQAKKSGSVKISATLEDGSVLTCSISVKNNAYSKPKQQVSSVTAGKTAVDVYKISYDSKGNLVIKANVLNNSSYTCTKIDKLKITVKTLAGKTVATYSVKNKKTSIKAGGKKAYTFTVKKKNVKVKKADLRNIKTPVVSGKVTYKRF